MNVLSPHSSHEADFTKRRLDQPMLARLIPYLRPYHAVLGRSFIASSHPRLALQIQDVHAQGLATTRSWRRSRDADGRRWMTWEHGRGMGEAETFSRANQPIFTLPSTKMQRRFSRKGYAISMAQGLKHREPTKRQRRRLHWTCRSPLFLQR